MYNGFHHLLDWKAFEQGYISGNLLIVSSESKMLQENYLMQIAEKLKKTRGEELWRKMQGICSDANYHPALRAGMRKALELINLLNDSSPDKTQHLLQDSQHADQYYVLPLLVLMLYSIIKEHFLNEKAEAEDETFRSLLANYARSLYPITTVLPIGNQYAEFPFLFFRSFTFKEIRNKMFSDTHMLISNEMNVLNMILSYKDH